MKYKSSKTLIGPTPIIPDVFINANSGTIEPSSKLNSLVIERSFTDPEKAAHLESIPVISEKITESGIDAQIPPAGVVLLDRILHLALFGIYVMRILGKLTSSNDIS